MNSTSTININILLDALLLNGNYLTTLLTITLGLLGAVAGVVGTFALIRRVSMIGDVISHANLPGVATAFLFTTLLGLPPFLPVLLVGASLCAAFATYAVFKTFDSPKVSEDTAIAAAIGGFFSLGILLNSITQAIKTEYTINFADFLIGSPARLTQGDAITVAIALLFILAIALYYRKPFIISSFDPENAKLQGFDSQKIDKILLFILLLTAVVTITCIGAILMIALITLPAITARLWSYHVNTMLVIASITGACSAYLGTALSAAILNLPPSGSIILVNALLFGISYFVAPLKR